MFDPVPAVDNISRIPFILQHYPGGTSLNSFVHYAQMIEESKTRPYFRKFNYGVAGNMKAYGQRTPPLYDLGLIKIPVSMFIGTKDPLGDEQDNQILYQDLIAKGIQVKRYFLTNWGHLTFLWTKDASTEFAAVLKEIKSA